MVERRQQWVFAETGFIQRLLSQPAEGRVHEIFTSMGLTDLFRAVK